MYRDNVSRNLASFTPIGLDELNATASLQHRTDRKYLVTEATAQSLTAWLQELATRNQPIKILELDQQRWQTYSSTYFDTPDLLCYRAALQQNRHRFKVRTRTYANSGQTFLEVKTKSPRGQTIKERVMLAGHERQGLFSPSALGFLQELLPYPDVTDLGLGPRLRTQYQRATLLIAEQSIRITIDRALSWQDTLHNQERHTDMMIVEVKSAGGTCAVDRWLWGAKIRPATVSKYAVGLAAFHPQLPRGKWQRAITAMAPGTSQPVDVTV